MAVLLSAIARGRTGPVKIEFKFCFVHITTEMSNVKINESPNHFIVLDAIGRGLKSFDKIAKVTRLDKAQVELILNDLIEQRLVIRTEKKGLLGRKVDPQPHRTSAAQH